MAVRKFVRSGTGLNFPVLDTTGESDTSGSQNTDKNQTSLALGSAGYRERLEDKAGVNDKNVVGGRQVLESGGPLGHMEIDDDVKRESDEYQAEKVMPEAPHVQVLSGDLREAAQVQRDSDTAVAVRKYRSKMAKEAVYDGAIESMRRAAAATETQEDDKKVEQLSKRSCEDMPEIIDESVTVEDLLPNLYGKYM